MARQGAGGAGAAGGGREASNGQCRGASSSRRDRRLLVGIASGVVFMVAAGIRVEEKAARRRNLARQRGVTLYDDATSAMTRSARWLNTGRDHHS